MRHPATTVLSGISSSSSSVVVVVVHHQEAWPEYKLKLASILASRYSGHFLPLPIFLVPPTTLYYLRRVPPLQQGYDTSWKWATPLYGLDTAIDHQLPFFLLCPLFTGGWPIEMGEVQGSIIMQISIDHTKVVISCNVECDNWAEGRRLLVWHAEYCVKLLKHCINIEVGTGDACQSGWYNKLTASVLPLL